TACGGSSRSPRPGQRRSRPPGPRHAVPSRRRRNRLRWPRRAPPCPAGIWGCRSSRRRSGGRTRPSRPSRCRARWCGTSPGGGDPRILPAYYAALVATVGLLLFPSRTRAYGLPRHNVALNLLLHATFLQHNVGSALGLPEGFGINGAVWTLSIEALFYLLLPLVAVRFFRRPVIGLGLGLGIAAAWRLAVAHSTLHV